MDDQTVLLLLAASVAFFACAMSNYFLSEKQKAEAEARRTPSKSKKTPRKSPRSGRSSAAGTPASASRGQSRSPARGTPGAARAQQRAPIHRWKSTRDHPVSSLAWSEVDSEVLVVGSHPDVEGDECEVRLLRLGAGVEIEKEDVANNPVQHPHAPAALCFDPSSSSPKKLHKFASVSDRLYIWAVRPKGFLVLDGSEDQTLWATYKKKGKQGGLEEDEALEQWDPLTLEMMEGLLDKDGKLKRETLMQIDDRDFKWADEFAEKMNAELPAYLAPLQALDWRWTGDGDDEAANVLVAHHSGMVMGYHSGKKVRGSQVAGPCCIAGLQSALDVAWVMRTEEARRRRPVAGGSAWFRNKGGVLTGPSDDGLSESSDFFVCGQGGVALCRIGDSTSIEFVQTLLDLNIFKGWLNKANKSPRSTEDTAYALDDGEEIDAIECLSMAWCPDAALPCLAVACVFKSTFDDGEYCKHAVLLLDLQDLRRAASTKFSHKYITVLDLGEYLDSEESQPRLSLTWSSGSKDGCTQGGVALCCGVSGREDGAGGRAVASSCIWAVKPRSENQNDPPYDETLLASHSMNMQELRFEYPNEDESPNVIVKASVACDKIDDASLEFVGQVCFGPKDGLNGYVAVTLKEGGVAAMVVTE